MSGLVFYDSEGNIAAQHIDGKGWQLRTVDGVVKSDNFMSRECNVYFDTERITHKSQAIDVINMLMDRFGVTVGEL